ncbi:hypothetical protein FDUTEX481_02073 [Tolypothrix sp. PCC 7601]|nr:hypothetical protein FDUTEX481_02073 [Tolypothrix sp. PCC 7601]
MHKRGFPDGNGTTPIVFVDPPTKLFGQPYILKISFVANEVQRWRIGQ